MPGKVDKSATISVAETPIQFVRGVGPKKAAGFSRLDIDTAEDLLWHIPSRYEDRSLLRKIGELEPGPDQTVLGQVDGHRLIQTRKARFTILELRLQDSTGTLFVRWFNQAYLASLFYVGQLVMVSGVVKEGAKRGAKCMMESPIFELVEDDPEHSLVHVGRIVPIYHGTKTITSRFIRSLVKRVLDQHHDLGSEILPTGVCERLGLITFNAAMSQVHFPVEGALPDQLNRGLSDAHRRLAFEELFLIELGLGLKKVGVQQKEQGISFPRGGALIGQLRRQLPFTLMSSQERVIREIMLDMASLHPMHRLLQGDVGCGKTVVAAFAMVRAAEAGYQTVVLAPTAILAEQHFLNLSRLLEPLGLRCALVISGRSKAKRVEVLASLAEGDVEIAIGTHALLEEDVRFHRLGVVVVDEQHRFGVLQRAALKHKGMNPDVLVMTATPIPRTLALTVYGDLDVSVIDTRPPGRQPVQTLNVTEAQRARAYRLLLRELQAGRQAFVVYPLVDESEKLDLQAAVRGHEQLQALFEDYSVGLIHGRMKVTEKQAVMAAFTAGAIHVLVATTVVEVGIDVPNATMMLIEHSERYGLAQLHQLRGRIGRGQHPSLCVLISSAHKSSESAQRLNVMVRTDDGFKIAEEDLMMRGPGDFFGVRQWGLPSLRVANLLRDVGLLEQARTEAFQLLDRDPQLSHPDHARLKGTLQRRWKDKLDLVATG